MKPIFTLCTTFLLLLTGCSNQPSKPTLKIAATSIPHAEILEFIKPELQKQDIDLEIFIIDDFNTPNRAVAEGEVDANFFQHAPFLEAQKEDFGYKLEILAAVHLEPMGLYSKKYAALSAIQDKALIAVPSDPSNLARALVLLEQSGLISLKSRGPKTSVLDIAENSHQFQFIEIDAPLLARSLEDVDMAAITTNFALLGGLSPKTDALALEDDQSDFVNLLVIREGESQRKELQTLKKFLTNEAIKQFIDHKYSGQIIPILHRLRKKKEEDQKKKTTALA